MKPSARKMGEINIIKLINSIKVRPALYNKDDSMYYSHKKYKYKLWREVCQEVYRNWECLAPHEKLEYARELQKRWKSLRTCFSREVALQKKERIKKERNEPFKKRKKYEYFNTLLFLVHPDKLDEYNINSDSDEDPLEPSAPAMEYASMDAHDGGSDHEANNFNSSDKFKPSSSSHIKLENSYVAPLDFDRPVDEKLLDILRENRELENDEDRMFALSLVSLFRNLNPAKKIEARIEVLKLLQTITYRSHDTNNRYS